MRLDKMLSHMGYGSRRDIKKLCKDGLVMVDGKAIKDSSIHIDLNNQRVWVGDEEVIYKEFVYLMLNKPPGVISATEDNHHKTVIDLLTAEHRSFNPFPVGRLDIDTEGLLLLTNDGQTAHKLLAPKKHVDKTYFARISGLIGDEAIEAFKEGVTLEDGYKTLPAELKIQSKGEESEIYVTIVEGKFHQVKRMFEAIGHKVTYLKRIRMGGLVLDEGLKLGEYRELSEDELQQLFQ
ncbi:rRNA pseudouridine synthase [Alkaliphilus serpentinus]|uniref:Pseudouridine synthase n=2 Tax=Alkaliphilus serpentinus TaxID=1482731 RepID=A0A833M7H7_9FIRM|nr:rRNA pseudouridine synthase [Alkaliphilus serpentinus]